VGFECATPEPRIRLDVILFDAWRSRAFCRLAVAYTQMTDDAELAFHGVEPLLASSDFGT
jgi:hypothetical protein